MPIPMEQSPRHLEGVAKEIHDETGVECPVDAFVLADLCGLTCRPWSHAHGQIEGELIRYPAKARHTRQHGIVAHELGHWALRRGGCDDRDEAASRYLAGALLLPRAQFLADLAATEWDLFAMMSRHPNASAEMVACRMAQVSPAVASIYDEGHLTRRYVGEDAIEDAQDDARIADRVLAGECCIRGELAAGYPLIDGRHRRAVIIRRVA
jgi:hypothetical protein